MKKKMKAKEKKTSTNPPWDCWISFHWQNCATPSYQGKLLILLHFVAFFHVASLFSTGVDNEKVGVDNEKALELGSRIIFSHFTLLQYRNITQKSNKTSFCIVA